MCSFFYAFSLGLLMSSCLPGCFSYNNVHYLDHGDIVNFKPKLSIRELRIFCYLGKPKYIIHIWQSVVLQINHFTDDYNQYEGPSPEAVEKEFFENKYSWSVNNIFSTKQKSIKLNPFNTSCIGIDSKDPYTVHLNIIRIDFWKLLLLGVGVLLFISAGKLSTNTLFHYICGVSLGICASCLILIYFVSRIFPRKPLMYGVLGCGWTIVIYVVQILWDNMRTIIANYKSYVIWYTVITGIISFILCYRWGPVENPRTKNLIKWTLQVLGLLSIFFSSHFQEAAMGQIVILLISYNLPKKWVAARKLIGKKKKFPPKVKLLSNDAYYEQGVRETAKALEELREYCSSPKCNQWKTALKIKDVKRFASFIEGNSHLSDEEILEYETSVQGELTDDEESDFTDEEESF
ncbi:hypothetical protein NQ314_011830 [Rhamnusium bicolor]|uniref:Nuclear envelope integral membrane protein 1 n=1 Tax=Rhamnusium bicolor TaxID=1586634 RepID=A0AAV8XEN6_9CUCU|nr:hypothetical protein NQ314_011830 [Rhamnusium bicolor]